MRLKDLILIWVTVWSAEAFTPKLASSSLIHQPIPTKSYSESQRPTTWHSLSTRDRQSALFSARGGEDSTPQRQKRQNLRVLGRLSVSGLLAYGYMRYYAAVTVASLGYYLYQKLVSWGTVCLWQWQSRPNKLIAILSFSSQVAKKGVQHGEWIMLIGIMFGLGLVRKIIAPAKFVLELVVTSFFSYFFVNLANGEL